MTNSRLLVARDPALAGVVRIFVGAVAERWNVAEPARADLRLAASELFAGAVEAGDGEDVSFTISSEGDRISLDATGVDPLGSEETPDPAGWGGRLELIRALFPHADVGESVRITVDAGSTHAS
jgi:hypothetical protein